MQKYIDRTKITYMDSTEEMKKYYFWYYSKEKESYVSSTGVHDRCGRFCEEDHPYYWSNIPFHDHYNLTESRQSEDAIGCFGCSVTFGAQLPEQIRCSSHRRQRGAFAEAERLGGRFRS